jgi:hypothetical protein
MIATVTKKVCGQSSFTCAIRRICYLHMVSQPRCRNLICWRHIYHILHVAKAGDTYESSSAKAGRTKMDKAGAVAASSWSALFMPIPPPLCTIHRRRVNKPGPNKSKAFSNYLWPGYCTTMGRHERLRERVFSQYKFMWASDASRKRRRGGCSKTRDTRLSQGDNVYIEGLRLKDIENEESGVVRNFPISQPGAQDTAARCGSRGLRDEMEMQ